MRVLAFSREAGGAEAILPVVELALKDGLEVLLTGKDQSLDNYSRAGVRAGVMLRGDADEVAALCGAEWGVNVPDVLLTSAVSLPHLDMTENRLWRWAEEAGVPTLAVLDQWQNYALRFSGPGDDERLAYLPGLCCVMDETARQGMVEEGFPPGRIAVTGQPAFDKLTALARDFGPPDRAEVLRAVGLNPERKTVMFAAEVLKRHFGHGYGFTEAQSLDLLAQALEEMAEPLQVALKLHPQSELSDFAAGTLDKLRRGGGLAVVAGEVSPWRLALGCDVTVGMMSVLLTEAALLGRPVAAVLPGAGEKALAQCHPVKAGAIAPLVSAEGIARALTGLLHDDEYHRRWMERQRAVSHESGAAGRVLDKLKALL